MDWIRVSLSRCAALFRRKRLDADLDEELRAHIELAMEENRTRGMSEQQARTAALRVFGGVASIRESYRIQRGLPWLEQTARDIGYAVRQLRRSPGFALTAILTLALGIGAVTSVFTVVNAVLLKPFAFRDPDRLTVMREAEEDAGSGERTAIPVNYRHFLRLRHDAKTLEDASIIAQRGLSVSLGGDHPHISGTVSASPNLFRLLGVQPILGRDFVEDDARQNAQDVVILSYEGWQTFFARDPAVIGKTLRIDGHPASVIGVLPPGIRFPQIALAPKIAFQEFARDAVLFAPLTPSERDLTADMGNFNYKVIARLRPGVTLAQADAELEALQKAYTLSAHLPLHFAIALTPLAKDVASGVSGALWTLFAAVGAVLLIACVNLANLQLARAVSAERETAVRAALGASRGQLVRSRLTESLVLAFVGGAAGIALAFLGTHRLLALVPANVPAWTRFTSARRFCCLPRDCRWWPHSRSESCLRCVRFGSPHKLRCRQIRNAPPILGKAAGYATPWLRPRWLAPCSFSSSLRWRCAAFPSCCARIAASIQATSRWRRPICSRSPMTISLQRKMRPGWLLPTARSRLSVNCPACNRSPSPA